MYNNAINSCIEDLKTEILSFMPVYYDFFMLPLASGLMKGSRLALFFLLNPEFLSASKRKLDMGPHNGMYCKYGSL